MKRSISTVALMFVVAGFGCEKSTTPPGERATITTADCEARGGTIVGDIGDGATQKPEYVCPSGQPPIGNIAAEDGKPIGVEGAVCCPS